MQRFYVCPVCGNVIRTVGEAVVSCCGVVLPPLEAEEPDAEHLVGIEPIEDEYWVTVAHPMTKDHHISFLAALSDNAAQFVKLYPEGDAGAHFKRDRVSMIFAFCNRDGLFCVKP